MAFKVKDLTPVGEEQQVIMCVSHHQESYGVSLPGYHADDALATTMVGCVSIGWYSFDKSPTRERYCYPLVGDKVFYAKLHHLLLTYLSSPGIPGFRA